MKIYEYQCQNCTISFKKLFLIVEDAAFACPRCGDNSAKKALNYTTLSPDKGIGLWPETDQNGFPGWSNPDGIGSKEVGWAKH